MNLRTKAFGFVSALALAATMTAGVASAQSVDTSVTLANVDGTCTLSNVSTDASSFGTLTWNPANEAYEGTLTDIGISGTLTHSGAPGHRGCGLSVVASALETAFPASAVSLSVNGVAGGFHSLENPLTIVPDGTQIPATNQSTGTLKLDASAVSNDVIPDTYGGTLTFTVTQGN